MEMNLLQAVFLGVVQGLTEFIPVSSSAHVTIVPQLFGWANPSTNFVLFVHFGTLVSLLIYFRRKIWNYIKTAIAVVTDRKNLSDRQKVDLRIITAVVIAAIPAGIAGLLLQDVIEQFYDSGDFQGISNVSILIAMAAVGLLFVFNDQLFTGKKKSMEKLNIWQALVIGASQAVAFVRGISRSGITLLSGQMMGLNKVSAAEFSFLISIPILIGTSALGVYDLASEPNVTQDDIAIMAAGFLSAAISGYFAVRFMLEYLKNNSLRVFGIYRIVFAITVLLILFY